MNCLNIMQIVAKIKKLKDFDELAFFILTTSRALALPKTMVFVNSLDKGVTLVIYLQNLLFTYIKYNRKRLIKTFISILKLDIKAKYQKKIYNDNTRI